MKIIIATGIFIPEAGGPATYAPQIAEEFLALGHQVKVLTYSDKDSYDFDQALPYQVKRIKRGNKLMNYGRYYWVFKKMAKISDIIYTFDHFSAGLPAAKFCQQYKKPLYIRVGGDFIWERHLDMTNNLVTLAEFYRRNLHQTAESKRFKLIQWVFGRATGIIFTTEFQRDIFQQYYHLSPDKLFIIHNPVNPPTSKIVRSQPNKEIIFSGRFIHKNNIINLIKAFADIKDKTYKLVLIGEGPIRSEIKQTVSDLKLSNVKIEKRMSRQDLLKRVSAAYLAVWPSLTDISPNSMLEALSMNVPVLSSSEIGFDFLKSKIKLFNPLSLTSMTEAINELLDPVSYQEYSQVVANIDYTYSYTQAASDTINIFKHASS